MERRDGTRIKGEPASNPASYGQFSLELAFLLAVRPEILMIPPVAQLRLEAGTLRSEPKPRPPIWNCEMTKRKTNISRE